MVIVLKLLMTASQLFISDSNNSQKNERETCGEEFAYCTHPSIKCKILSNT